MKELVLKFMKSFFLKFLFCLPLLTNGQEYYLVYKVEEITDFELQNQKWDITKLDKHKQGRGSALPFSVTLTELMNVKVK